MFANPHPSAPLSPSAARFSAVPLSTPTSAATSALPTAIVDAGYRGERSPCPSPPPYSAVVPSHGYYPPHHGPSAGPKAPLTALGGGAGTRAGVFSALLAPLAALGDRSEEEALSTSAFADDGVPAVQLFFRTVLGAWAALRAAATPANVSFAALCSLWYLSSALSSNTGKVILNTLAYPVTLTFAQFFFVAGYCLLLSAARRRFGKNSSRRLRGDGLLASLGVRTPSRTALEGTFAMCMFQVAGHVFSSMAIARVPVSTVHTIKALSPMFTVLSYALLFRVRYSSATYLSLLPLTLGVMLACSGQLHASASGFLFALGSTVVFVSQNIFSKKLLPKDDPAAGGGGGAGGLHAHGHGGAAGGKLDKLELLLFSSGMAFCAMVPIWIYSDALHLLSCWWTGAPVAKAPVAVGRLLWFFFLNGTVHFAQNYLAFATLARTSPVTYSIASLVKRIVVICFAIVTFGQHVGPTQALGIALTFAGLYMYNRAKGDVDRSETLREKRDALVLPSTQDDAQVMMSTTPPRARSPAGVPSPAIGIANPLELGRTRPRRLSISRDRGSQ